MKDVVSTNRRNFYMKTKIKLQTFLTRGDVATKLKDLWMVQEMDRTWSSSFCNRKRKAVDENEMPPLPSPSSVLLVLPRHKGYEDYIKKIEEECKAHQMSRAINSNSSYNM